MGSNLTRIFLLLSISGFRSGHESIFKHVRDRLFIAHRLSALQIADCMHVMKVDIFVEQRTYQELTVADGPNSSPKRKTAYRSRT